MFNRIVEFQRAVPTGLEYSYDLLYSTNVSSLRDLICLNLQAFSSFRSDISVEKTIAETLSAVGTTQRSMRIFFYESSLQDLNILMIC